MDLQTVEGIANKVAKGRNKIYLIHGVTDGIIDISNANEHERLDILPYKTWRVIGLGMFWTGASAANEDPVIEYGYPSDQDAFGKMTSAITGGEKFRADDHQKYDPLDLLAPEVITETSATMVVTWTEGVEFGVWQTAPLDVRCWEAAVAGMTAGYIIPYMLVEVDSGGKW